MKLFEPLTIRKVTLKNRLNMLSMGYPGQVGDMQVNYFIARARGGVGSITAGRVRTFEKILDNVEDMRPLVEAVHKAAPDCKIGIQPSPVGKGKDYFSPSGPVSPATYSALVWGPELPFQPVGMTRDDIHWYVEKMAESAYRQKQTGFDFLELHGTHSYLIRQFLSPLDNHREDEYGGTLANRMRFPLEMVKAIRAAVGNDFLIFFKLCALEEAEGGITLDESARLAMELEKAGTDVLVVTQGVTNHPRGYINTVTALYNYRPLGCYVDWAAYIKKFVNIHVEAACRIHTPELAESVLVDGKADLIGLGRPLIADPDLPNKIASGDFAGIRPCLSCNVCIDWSWVPANQSPCCVNALARREVTNRVSPAEKSKKVVVVGGGPAGMEAARVAADRGHDVTLIEKENTLGGTLIAASKPPMKERIDDFRKYLTNELHRTGVKIRLGKAASVASIMREKPDAVVVATGGRLKGLSVPGATGENVVTADDVLIGKAVVGERVLVVGGGLVGLETAEYLAARGKTVFLIGRRPELGMNIFPLVRPAIVWKAREAGVVTYVNTKLESIGDGVATINVDGTPETLRVDTVVQAAGREPEKSLAGELQGKVPEIHVVGDAVSSRMITDAIHEGHRVGRTL
ncbi:MAG: FAD-dependent oxidoreductase [Dehalococcoidia bacterium]|nr:FAD-dependent oxidoreductase [Dehalococcoidia bacterium]